MFGLTIRLLNMVCGKRYALPTPPTNISTCTEVNFRMEGIGTNKYPSLHPVRQRESVLESFEDWYLNEELHTQ
jgi:hypothetical protein